MTYSPDEIVIIGDFHSCLTGGDRLRDPGDFMPRFNDESDIALVHGVPILRPWTSLNASISFFRPYPD